MRWKAERPQLFATTVESLLSPRQPRLARAAWLGQSINTIKIIDEYFLKRIGVFFDGSRQLRGSRRLFAERCQQISVGEIEVYLGECSHAELRSWSVLPTCS
jgi:hypothetical protein